MEESRVSVAGANLNVLLVFFPLENGGNEELCCALNHPKNSTLSSLLNKVKPCSAGLLLGWVAKFEYPM